MKKNNISKTIVLLALALVLSKNANAQSDVSGIGVGHIGLVGEYSGWNAGTTIPLIVQHLGTNPAQSINFLTGGTQRMIVTNGTGLTSGFVGIGDGFSTPQNLLHINGFGAHSTGSVFRTDCDTNLRNTWQMYVSLQTNPNFYS